MTSDFFSLLLTAWSCSLVRAAWSKGELIWSGSCIGTLKCEKPSLATGLHIFCTKQGLSHAGLCVPGLHEQCYNKDRFILEFKTNQEKALRQVWLFGSRSCHVVPSTTGSAISSTLLETEIPNTGKWVKKDLKQYYHHWFLEVSHQQPAILRNQQEGRVWSSKLHSSNDNSLYKRWDQYIKFLERSTQTKTNPLYLCPGIVSITLFANSGIKKLTLLRGQIFRSISLVPIC